MKTYNDLKSESKYCPFLQRLIAMESRGLNREQALIEVVFALSEALREAKGEFAVAAVSVTSSEQIIKSEDWKPVNGFYNFLERLIEASDRGTKNNGDPDFAVMAKAYRFVLQGLSKHKVTISDEHGELHTGYARFGK